MKLRTLLCAGALTLALTAPASALTLKVDGVDLTEQAGAHIYRGTTYVSLRTVSELLDDSAQVSWNGRSAGVSTDQVEITATIGARYIALSNGKCLYIPNGVRLIEGRTMVPVRTLAAALGGEVAWDGETSTVSLTTGDGAPQPAAYDQEDLYWLSRIISAESRGEPLEGKLAVGTVVLNRVASGQFPNTIKEVIFDRKWGVQFTPVANGTVYDDPTEESVLAAKLVLEGARAAGDSLYFFAPALTDDRWIPNHRTYVTTIGCHQFYR